MMSLNDHLRVFFQEIADELGKLLDATKSIVVEDKVLRHWRLRFQTSDCTEFFTYNACISLLDGSPMSFTVTKFTKGLGTKQLTDGGLSGELTAAQMAQVIYNRLLSSQHDLYR